MVSFVSMKDRYSQSCSKCVLYGCLIHGLFAKSKLNYLSLSSKALRDAISEISVSAELQCYRTHADGPLFREGICLKR